LAQALRSPTTRGKWGEIHLQRALESVGMLEFVDFVQQDVQKTDDSFQKPDFVIHLPNQRSIVIDAKVPIDAFLDAMQDNISEGERKAALKRHAEQIRKHIKVLASKAYWEKLDSPEFVLMYLTSDSHYAAALESDPTLFEAGIENKVFLMTPSTLFPTLRVVEHAWKQEKLAQNAKEISTLGQELYKRLCVFGSHIDKMGRGLSTSLKAYDDAVGSLERTVMPAARKFRELQSMNDTDILTAAEPIARLPRQLNAPDFLLANIEE
jgi:DNA recombination protein RmuC